MNLHIEITNAESFDQHLIAYNNFLRKAAAEAKHPSVLRNMGNESPSGLLHLIDSERGPYRRWTQANGEIALLYESVSNKLVGISAVENSTLSDNLASGGNRLWILKENRGNHAITNYLLNSNFKWAQRQNKIGMVLTFNEYNKEIYNAITMRTCGKTSTLGKFWSDWWNDCVPLPVPILLHNTAQWAVIKPISSQSQIDEEIKELVEIYRYNGQ